MLSLHSRIYAHENSHMRTYIHLHTPLPLNPVLKLHFFHSCTQILSFFSTETSRSPPMALGPLNTIKRYRLMKYRECSGFNFMVPITANCNMANYSLPCRIASAIVSCPHQTKFQANGTWGASIEHFIILIMWTYDLPSQTERTRQFGNLSLGYAFLMGTEFILFSFPDVPDWSEKETSSIDNIYLFFFSQTNVVIQINGLTMSWPFINYTFLFVPPLV